MGVEINNSFHFQNILHTLFRQMVGQNENQYPDLDSLTQCVICHWEVASTVAISFEKSEIAFRPGGSAEKDTSFAMTILQIGRWKHTDLFQWKIIVL